MADLEPVLVTAAGTRPVTATEAKLHLRETLSDATNDSLIEDYIDAAVSRLEGYHGALGLCFIDQTWQQDYACFEDGMPIPLNPSSISSITYYDPDNASQTLASSVYDLFLTKAGAQLGLKPGQTFPATYSRPDAVRITFVAGYGSASTDVPQELRLAIMAAVAAVYDMRVGADAEHFENVIMNLAGQRRARYFG